MNVHAHLLAGNHYDSHVIGSDSFMVQCQNDTALVVIDPQNDVLSLMQRHESSINDVPIFETDRKFFWPAPGPRPADHPGIPDVI